MSEKGTTFEFNAHSGIEDNLALFGDHIRHLDAELGDTLYGGLQSLLDDDHEPAEIWEQLLSVCTTSPEAGGEADGTESEVPANEPASNVAQPQATPTLSGWFLEGISVEGFRGVNNEDEPLELKFDPDKVNSVSAVNGAGKTSIYDSIRYAITGSLPWLDDLPADERDKDYYFNRFHTRDEATIKLQLVAEPGGEKCEVTVVRHSDGSRTASAPAPWNAETILAHLDREFVFLDGPTFQTFITAKPLFRGRTFSGLLGLASYSNVRGALTALTNTRAFNNHFDVKSHQLAKDHEKKTLTELAGAIAKDYATLVGEPLGDEDQISAEAKCKDALVQIAPLSSICKDKDFDAIDVDECIKAIKVSEGGPERERLGECIRDRGDLAKLNHENPNPKRAAQLAFRAKEREQALEKTAGDLMLELYQTGAKVVGQPEWNDPQQCPLCDGNAKDDMQEHLTAKLSQFEVLGAATTALATEWSEGSWADLLELESKLEPTAEKRLLASFETQAEAGTISHTDADNVVQWLATVRSLAADRDKVLETEQLQLEEKLPPSSVEVTTKVEAARRLQESWRRHEQSEEKLWEEEIRDGHLSRLRNFLTETSKVFSLAETELSKARLAAVEPVFQDFFKKMSFYGVVPAVSKQDNKENLEIRLDQFHGLEDLSPQAMLSESFRNAFATSLYLAAASLFGGLPKFIVLDDVTSSFDAGHQHFLMELIRTTFARPGNASGPQVILLSHDTTLEKLFNKHSGSGAWFHQRIEGSPQIAVLPQAGAVNKVRDRTVSMLQAGQVTTAQDGVRQYLEYRLNDLVSKLRIPVPVDIAFNDDKKLAGEFIKAIDAAVKLNKAAGTLILKPEQEQSLNLNMATIIGNFLSHWGTGQAMTFNANALLGVMQSIDDYCDCFTHQPSANAAKIYYKSLSQT